MYRKDELHPTSLENFEIPSDGELSPDNRWVIMDNIIPWSESEEEYHQNLSEEMVAPAKTFRMSLGELINKDKFGKIDRETVKQIKENPYIK